MNNLLDWTVNTGHTYLRRVRMLEFRKDKNNLYMGSGVAQLVERSLPIPEVRGSNPVIGKKIY